MKNSQGGYVGLIVLLLSVCFIIFFILRTDIFSGKDENMIERDKQAVDAAEAVKTQIELNSQSASYE